MIYAKGKGYDNVLDEQSSIRMPRARCEGSLSNYCGWKLDLSDGTPTMYLDLIPIRTPPRYGPRGSSLSRGNDTT